MLNNFGEKMNKKIKYLLDYFKLLKNPVSCLLFKFNVIHNVEVKFKGSNETVYLNKNSVINDLMGMLQYQDNITSEFIDFINALNSKNKIISWAGGNIFNYTEVDLSNTHVVFFEYFNRGYWSDFEIDYKNRCVIDVGSHIGDSCLYFAANGANVYAFEPVKYLYDYSLKLKDINPELSDNMHFFNKGVSDKSGILSIESMDSTSAYLKNDKYDVEVTTIEDILNDYNIQPDILKMDCEGCEFNIILNEDLSDFNDIIFEHHSKIVGKDYNLLIDKLKSEGFKIKKMTYGSTDFEDMGLIHAYK